MEALAVHDPTPHGPPGALTAAFRALEAFPVLEEARDRLLRVVRRSDPSPTEVVMAVESDFGLVIALLRQANAAPAPGASEVASVAAAVERLSYRGVEAVAQGVPVFQMFERLPTWRDAPERFRVHARATHHVAERLADETAYPDREELLTLALLHDVGKLVLTHAYRGYPAETHGSARTPEERVRAERRHLGVDHASIGGVLARRWSLPERVATAIERHHDEDARGQANLLRLADMLAHYGQGHPVELEALMGAGEAAGLSRHSVSALMYELPYPIYGPPRQVAPSPLSARELEVLKKLAEGRLLKQIALDLHISPSTVRTHLQKTYEKLGAADRAQAVLAAKANGWI